MDEELEDFLIGFGQHLCPHAGCGFVALLCLFYKMNINFCPLKFIQKCGKVTRSKELSCTNILTELKKLNFFNVFEEDCSEENHDEKLKDIEIKLKGTEQKAGLLWYSKDDTKHCVTVYVTSTGTQMEIVDAQLNRNYITDLPSVRKLELLVLKFNHNRTKILIEEQWKDCHADICKEESQKLSEARAW